MKDKEKEKKVRYLSPSFKKGVVKEKKEDPNEEESDFKINLIKADDDEEEDEKDGSKSPSKHKRKSTKGKEEKHKKEIPEDMKVNALPQGRVKSVSSQSKMDSRKLIKIHSLYYKMNII